MDIFSQIAFKIIQEQELIIGPLAWDEAKKVEGIKIIESEDKRNKARTVQLDGNHPIIIDNLVARFDRLFGRASHEVSLGAAAPFLDNLSSVDVPVSLRG